MGMDPLRCVGWWTTCASSECLSSLLNRLCAPEMHLTGKPRSTQYIYTHPTEGEDRWSQVRVSTLRVFELMLVEIFCASRGGTRCSNRRSLVWEEFLPITEASLGKCARLRACYGFAGWVSLFKEAQSTLFSKIKARV